MERSDRDCCFKKGEVAIRFLDYSEPSTAQDAYIHIERGAFIKFLQTHSLSGEDKNYAESGCIRITPDMVPTEGWKYLSAAAAQRENMWFTSSTNVFFFSSFRNKEKPMINALKYDLNGEEHEIHLSTFYAMSPREFRKR